MSTLRFFILLLIAVIDVSTGFQIPPKSDAEFENFLTGKMREYGKWLEDNNLDPSLPIPDTIPLKTEDHIVELNCNISKQYIRNHVKAVGFEAEVHFARHVFYAGRQVREPYEFHGEYSCTGIVLASYHEGLEKDLPFSGVGNWTAIGNYTDEGLEVVNFGITEDYRFDMSHTHTSYAYTVYSNLTQVQLEGEWDSDLTNYLGEIQVIFKDLYREHLVNQRKPLAHLNPSRELLIRYLNEVIRYADLNDILTGDLPPPYIPTPSTPPSTAPTTNMISSSTTPGQTTENSGGTSRVFLKSENILIQLAIMCLSVLLTPKIYH